MIYLPMYLTVLGTISLSHLGIFPGQTSMYTV